MRTASARISVFPPARCTGSFGATLSHFFPKPPRSYGRFDVTEPGELIALDIKSLGSLAEGG